MGKGGYHGGGTVVSPIKNPDWFSNGDDEADSPTGGPKKPIPIPHEVDQEIASLRRSIPALEGQLRRIESDLSSEKAKLRRLLEAYGQPLDEGLI